ncbi:CKL2 [Symbiodinium natans]|uniref:Casein kinase I n=1 Tax=Symbiodinium natans TaxID=878477 RepID=A0A812TXD8_9DINO|nr:CKL2 [Symbiodinium natans]
MGLSLLQGMGPLEAATGGEILGFASIVNWPGEEEEYEEETEEDDPEVRSLHNQESSEVSSIHPPPLPRTVAGRFRLRGEIGSGSYSEVYMGEDGDAGDNVAIKVEWHHAEKGAKLLEEAKFYKSLGLHNGSAPQWPLIRWVGTEGEYDMMVMDLLGPSLDAYFKHCGSFSLKTTLTVALQIIDRLEYVHSCGILYRDIKPHNFLMGLGEHSSRVYIVDFGLAKRYIDKHGRHIACSSKKRSGVTGTVRYSSINVHEGVDASRRDDLEATGYMFVHFLRGDLPWLGLKAHSKKSKHKAIGRVKQQTSDEELCKGYPDEFREFIAYSKSLGYADQPDYEYLRGMFRKLFERQGFRFDGQFDWTGKTLGCMFRACSIM